MLTTDPAVRPTGPAGGAAPGDRCLTERFPPGFRGQWSVPVWALSVEGHGQWCNALAKTWLRDSPGPHTTPAPTRPLGRYQHYPSCLEAVISRALASPEELPTRAAISRGGRQFEILVSRLDDASGRRVGILLAGLPSRGTGR